MTTTASQPTQPARPLPAGWMPAAGRIWRKPTLRALLGALLVTGAIILLRGAGWLQPVELLAYDRLVEANAHAAPASNDRFLLIGLNEKDIHRFRYPLSDDALGDLLDRVASWQPRVIAVDIYREMSVLPDSGRLAAVLKAHPEIVWVFGLGTPGNENDPPTPPPPELKGSDRVGLADVPSDADGIVRRGLLLADDGTQNYPGLGFAVALRYLAQEHIQLGDSGDDDTIRLGKAVIAPLDDQRGPYMRFDSSGYQMLLDYRGGRTPFRRHSVGEAMDQDLSALVRGRAVIVGGTEATVKDTFSTPFNTGFGGTTPDYGIEIHAHLADQLIRAAEGRTTLLTALPRRGEDLWILAWAIAGAGLGLLIRSVVPAVLAGAAGLPVIALIAGVAFGRGLLLPAVPAALAWAGAAALTNQVLYAAASRARQRLRKSFEHYLPSVVIDQMVKSDVLPSLGGERREIAVLFTDVAGFTTFSEGLDPAELAAVANEYFDGVCGAIFAHGGLVNAFIGDSVLAFFGAPLPQPDAADRAIAAALDVDRFSSRFVAEQAARGITFGITRIGLHTGIAFVGNIGAPQRLQYTALGDMLNTGSRLEGLNKAIGSRICASGAIAAKATRYRCRPVGAFVVKGRTGATDVYAPIDPATAQPDWEARYEAAFQAAEACRPEAAELFAALYRENPEDACVAFHHHRLAAGEVGTSVHMDEK